jgi:hypothetical protein
MIGIYKRYRLWIHVWNEPDPELVEAMLQDRLRNGIW